MAGQTAHRPELPMSPDRIDQDQGRADTDSLECDGGCGSHLSPCEAIEGL
jgi:hypothetical protein